MTARRRSIMIFSRKFAARQFLLKGGASLELDGAFDLHRQADAADGEDHFGRQSLIAFELAAADGGPHRLLDLALRGDADLLEKFAHADVQYILVHDRLAKVPETWPAWLTFYPCRRRKTTAKTRAR